MTNYRTIDLHPLYSGVFHLCRSRLLAGVCRSLTPSLAHRWPTEDRIWKSAADWSSHLFLIEEHTVVSSEHKRKQSMSMNFRISSPKTSSQSSFICPLFLTSSIRNHPSHGYQIHYAEILADSFPTTLSEILLTPR
jgi:hypothetical protein